MKIIKLDASRWSTILELHHDLLLALGAPKWHGASIAALVDTMIWGGINAVDPPYTIDIHHLDGAPDDVIEHAVLVRDCLSEACEEFLSARGRDVGVRVALVAGDQPLRMHRLPIDMTLRLWSAEVPLAPIIADIGIAVELLCDKGPPAPDDGYRPSATRHFAVIARAEGADAVALSDWLRQTSVLIAQHRDLAGALRAGTIEAVFWVTILGRSFVPTPVLEPDIMTSLAGLFLQNYTDPGPRKNGPPHQRFVIRLSISDSGKSTERH